MGVYIKGVKKPKACNECYLPFELCCAVCGFAEDLCPIVEVKEPHGRLMDLDAWLKNNGMLDDCKYCADRNNRISLYEKNYSKCDICNIVDDERTIVVVEAEGEYADK